MRVLSQGGNVQDPTVPRTGGCTAFHPQLLRVDAISLQLRPRWFALLGGEPFCSTLRSCRQRKRGSACKQRMRSSSTELNISSKQCKKGIASWQLVSRPLLDKLQSCQALRTDSSLLIAHCMYSTIHALLLLCAPDWDRHRHSLPGVVLALPGRGPQPIVLNCDRDPE